jgi:LysM repeat protein
MLREERTGPATHRCPACGAVVSRRARTCSLCGASLTSRWTSTILNAVRRVRFPRPQLFQVFRRPEARRCHVCGARVGLTAHRCALCESELGLYTGNVRSWIGALLPDLLLFTLVVGVVAFGWWWHPWQARPSTDAVSPTAPSYSLSGPTATPSCTATASPTAARATAAPTSSPTPTPTTVPTEMLAASATPSATPTTTRSPQVTRPLPSSTPSPTSTATPVPVVTATPMPTRVHVVVQGDTLGDVAVQYGLGLEALVQANPGLNPQRLRIGQELLIPTAGTGGAATLSSESLTVSRIVTHTVQQGETLLRIAGEYAVTLNDVYALNPGISPQFLRIGEVLRIEIGPPTPTPTPTPLPTATPLPRSAPVLLGPGEEADFRGTEAHILLWWTSVGILAEDEWYVVRLRHDGVEIEAWTKAPSWRVPLDLYPGSSDSPHFRWDVVVKHTGDALGGEATSPPSSTRSFVWQ